MGDYICRNCGYRFKAVADQKDKLCQYCGEKSVIKEPSADELLSEID
ncbi:hypothetical protein J4474_03305 [Candidatus Pacearchaeota archaeon]|nr:hypothetical protein [Candidatus Pacearchaeota archaeon]